MLTRNHLLIHFLQNIYYLNKIIEKLYIFLQILVKKRACQNTTKLFYNGARLIDKDVVHSLMMLLEIALISNILYI